MAGVDSALNPFIARALGRRAKRGPSEFQADYAMIDAARDPRIFPALTESRVEALCLYDGPLSESIARVAPYLVRMDMGSRFVRRFADDGWGHAWGTLIRAPTSITELRRHLRTLAYVRTPGHRKLLFRYYDPRVLTVFLPICDKEQLKQIFGPIRAFVLDDPPATASRDETGALQLTAWQAPTEPV